MGTMEITAIQALTSTPTSLKLTRELIYLYCTWIDRGILIRFHC